jgi:hypothetical protein
MPQRGMQAASHCQNTQEAQLAGSLIPTDQTRVDRLRYIIIPCVFLCCVVCGSCLATRQKPLSAFSVQDIIALFTITIHRL